MDKKQVVLTREREAYRAAIDVNLAEKERIRSAVLHAEAAPAKAARPRVRRPLVRIAIAAAALLLCTGAAFAAAEWIGRENYTPETYLFDRMGARSESEPIADVENAIAAAAPVNGSHSVQLLPALPDADVLAKWREEMGQPAFSESDWGWLRDVTPTIGEALVSGHTLSWNTRLTTDQAAAFSSAGNAAGQWLDAVTDSVCYTVPGDETKHILPAFGSGLHPNQATENSVVLGTECETDDGFPTSGTVAVTQVIRILDTRVDPMSNIGTLALIEHTFTLDAACGTATGETVHVSVPLKGGCILTLSSGDGAVRNERVILDGVVLDATIDYGSTGLYVRLTVAETPAGWTDAYTDALMTMTHASDMRGMRALYTVGGEQYEPSIPSFIPLREMAYILPVFPSDYDDLPSLTMELLLDRWTALNGEPCGEGWHTDALPTTWSADGESQPLASFEIPLP